MISSIRISFIKIRKTWRGAHLQGNRGLSAGRWRYVVSSWPCASASQERAADLAVISLPGEYNCLLQLW